MSDNNLYLDLAARISEGFPELDSDVITDFSDSNEEYAALTDRIAEMKKQHPFITQVLEDKGALQLSEQEHGILTEFFALYMQADNMEREQLYFRGHTDCIAYLKRIGAL